MVSEDGVSPSVEPGVQGRWFVPSHTPPVLEDSAKNSLGLFASRTDGSGAEVMQDCVAEEVTKCEPPTSSFLAEGAGLVKLRGSLKEGLSGFRFHELSQLLCECFDEILEKCDLKHCKVQRSGGVFPLPETLFGLTHCLPQEMFPREPFCLLAIYRALNSYHGVAWNDLTVITAAKKSSVEALASFAVDAIQWDEKIDDVCWGDLLSTRSVDYKGDEVRVSMQFRWENIKNALPDEVGRVALEEVCELGTRDFVVNFEDYLLPPRLKSIPNHPEWWWTKVPGSRSAPGSSRRGFVPCCLCRTCFMWEVDLFWTGYLALARMSSQRVGRWWGWSWIWFLSIACVATLVGMSLRCLVGQVWIRFCWSRQR